MTSSVITNSVVTFRQSILVYYATYNLCNPDTVPLLMAVTLVTMFVGMLLVPVVNSVIGKKGAYIVYGLGLTLSSLLFYFSGYGSEKSVILRTLVSGLFSGAPAVLESAILAGLIFTLIGYVPNAVQTNTVLSGLNAMMTIIPAAAVLVGLAPILFYKLTEAEHSRILKELDNRQNCSA